LTPFNTKSGGIEHTIVFVGGITDSKKTELLKSLQPLISTTAHVFPVGECFAEVFSSEDNPIGVEEIPYRDWKEREDLAVLKLIAKIREEPKQTCVIKTHYATYSPSGFMPGLEPPSLELIYTKIKPKRIGIVLIDCNLQEVLTVRSGAHSAKKGSREAGYSVTHIAEDLQYNRAYAWQYCSFLRSLSGGGNAVRYKRVPRTLPVDEKNDRDVKPLLEWLKAEGILAASKIR
jgi:adenylate kinase